MRLVMHIFTNKFVQCERHPAHQLPAFSWAHILSLYLHTLGSFCLFGFLSFFFSLRQGFILYPMLPQTHGSLLSQPIKCWITCEPLCLVEPLGFGQALLFDWKAISLEHAAQVWASMAQILFSLQWQFLPDLFLRVPIPEYQLLGSLLSPCWVCGTEGFFTLRGIWSSLSQLYSCWDLDRCCFNWIIVVEFREQPSPSQLFFQSDV